MQRQDRAGSQDVDVLSIGETMALLVPASPEPVGRAEVFRLDVGGAESNVACHLAVAGRRAAWFGAVGPDALGWRVRHRLSSLGVDTSRVRVDPTALTGLYVKDPGAGVSYYRRGSAASRLGPADLAGIDWDRVRIVHLSGISLALSPENRRLVFAAILAAHDHGVLVSFDVNHRPVLWESVSEAAETILCAATRADIVWVGRDEATAVWGTDGAADVRTRLFPMVQHLVVKDADVAATEFSPEGEVVVGAPRVKVVEPVGAGDAFAAGWIDAFLDGSASRARLARGHEFAKVALTSTLDTPLQVQGEGWGDL